MNACVYCSHPCRGVACQYHSDLLKIERMRWAGLPMGELHPKDRCSFCGNTRNVRRTVIQSTNAIGYRCEDSSACVRRRAATRAA